MTKVKFCGLTAVGDIAAANQLQPDYIGFVFAPKSKRYVTSAAAAQLKQSLSPNIKAVGVFVNESPETVASIVSEGIIDLIQLHGEEDSAYLAKLRALTAAPIIKAFVIKNAADVSAALASEADFLLLDAGAGEGKNFDWTLIKNFPRPYFLAGGLNPQNVKSALQHLTPYAVDVSSGIETNGHKDKNKMATFMQAVIFP